MIKYALLGLLRERPDHGYHLKKRFDERLGSLWRLNAGQVYQGLQALARARLVEEVAIQGDRIDSEGVRGRRVFNLTAKGNRALDRWLARPPRHARPARDETLLRLLVLAPERHDHAAAQIERLCHVYRQQATRLLAEKRRIPRDASGINMVRAIGIEAALLHAEAHIKWLEYTRGRLLGNEVPSEPTPERKQ